MAQYINLQITYENGSAASISGQVSKAVMTLAEQAIDQHRTDGKPQGAAA